MPQSAEAREYHRIKNILFFVELGLFFVGLGYFAVSGWSAWLSDFAAQQTESIWWQRSIYLTLLGALLFLIPLPLHWYSGFFLEHQFKLSNQTFLKWLIEHVKSSLLGLMLAFICTLGLYYLLDHAGPFWWWWAGLFWLLLNLGLARIMPSIIVPLFFKYAPIQDEMLKSAVINIFKKAQVEIQDAYLIDFSKKTKKANAFICGLGKSRRVVLTDNLVAEFTIPEIETVLAHELGHYNHHDIVKMTLLQAGLTWGGLYVLSLLASSLLPWVGVQSLADIAGLPVVMLLFMVFSLLTMPITNGFSRACEVAADRYSLELTGRPQDFLSMMDKLGAKNLAEFDPHPLKEFLFYSHPSLAKRLAFARQFMQKR